MDRKPVVRGKKPLILKKANMTILKGNGSFTPTNVSFFREDILHDTTDVYFLKGEYQRLIVVNRFNIVNKGSRTVAKYFCKDGSVLEKTSDKVTQVIGQEQYKTVFTALCSIIDQELKIRSILALLTAKTTDKLAECDKNDTVPKEVMDKCCQTDEMRLEKLRKPRRRIRKQVGPYIIQDQKLPEKKKVNKIIVHIPPNNQSVLKTKENSSNIANNLNSTEDTDQPDKTVENDVVKCKQNSMESLEDLGYLRDDYSDDGTGRFSVLSETRTIPELLTNPTSILDNVDQHTEGTYIHNFIVQPNFRINGTDIIVPFKPEDVFHMVTKENMRYLDKETRIKLFKHQMKIDKKHCLTVMDEDGNYPIHLAVLNNDLELLSRQCTVLKIRGSSVDISANGMSTLTALKLSLYQEPPHNAALAACLLRHGADPLRADDEHRAVVHVAAERDADLLGMVLRTCQENARRILSEYEELWKPEMETQTDEELAAALMKHMCSMFDKQGYSPLMLASRLGLYENVRILIEHSPSSVNDRMPTSGNTALYLTIAAACNSSAESGNKSIVVDRFRRTIEILLDNGADIGVTNHAGGSAAELLRDCAGAELQALVAQHCAVRQHGGITGDCTQVMLVKDEHGNIECKQLENERKKKSLKKNQSKEKNLPVIIKNVLLKSTDEAKLLKSTGDATSSDGRKVESGSTDDVNLQQKNKKMIFLQALPVPPGNLKRKISESPKTMKQAKVDK